MMTTGSPLAAVVSGGAPEVSVSRDIVRRGVMVAPLVLTIAGVARGFNGMWSAGYAVVLVLVNFALAALLIAWTAPISLTLMMGAILGGYIVRLGIITAAVVLVRNTGWIDIPALGVTIIVTHLGLLFWEMRYIAASLTFPGLRPGIAECQTTGTTDSDRRTTK